MELKSKQVSHLKTYPNPATFETNLVLTTTINSAASVSVWDTSGRQVYEQRISIQEGFNKHRIDVSQMPAGAYILRIEGEELDAIALNLAVNR